MQIHELTRRKITEAGFLGGLATGLQSALGKVGVQGPAATDADRFSGPMVNRAQALAAGQKTAQALMPVMMKDWTNKVQTAMAQSTDPATKLPPTSVGRLTTGEQARLKTELVSMVNHAIQSQGTFDYTGLANNIGDATTPEGQTIKATAMQAVQDISQAIDAIFNATLDPKADPSTAWQDLVRDGIAPAQGVLAYDSGSGLRSNGQAPGKVQISYVGPGDYRINFGQGWMQYDNKNPAHTAAAEKLKNTPS